MNRWSVPLSISIALFAFVACSKPELNADHGSNDAANCLATSKWTPSVSGASASNHDSNISIINETYTVSGRVFGLSDPVPVAQEVEVEIPMTQDLGLNGSISLVAQVVSFPGELRGNAYGFLVSLHDGANEYVNLTRTGAGSDCVQSGYFSCGSSSCSANPNCQINTPSAFEDRSHWEEYQYGAFGYVGTNTFPTCNWTGQSSTCYFNSNFFQAGKLKFGSGVTYKARFVILASNYTSVNSGKTATLKVSVVKKKDLTDVGALGTNGALDLNVIIIGGKNRTDAASARGQMNLDLLYTHVRDHYAQSSTGVQIGQINAYDWTDCPDSEGQYTHTDYLDIEGLFEKATRMLPPDQEGKSLNIFMVSSITFFGENIGILGISGAIRGPMLLGTGSSGLIFATFEKLGKFNPSCAPGSNCAINTQESFFKDMGNTISHEMGHYLGLNHPSESDATVHDPLPDTPECDAETLVMGGEVVDMVTHDSCLADAPCSTVCSNYSSGTFCPTRTECQFNHIMWWTTKNYSNNNLDQDGNIFSADSARVINYSPFVH